MNRPIVVPAAGCLLAYAALFAIFRSGGEASAAIPTKEEVGAADPAPATPAPTGPLSDRDAQKLLTNLADEYTRPWREWQNSPHRMLSRAAPRPIPPLTAEVVSAPNETAQAGNLVLATIVVTKAAKAESIPCIVDRTTKRAWVFADGKWLAQDEWLKQAPSPK